MYSASRGVLTALVSISVTIAACSDSSDTSSPGDGAGAQAGSGGGTSQGGSAGGSKAGSSGASSGSGGAKAGAGGTTGAGGAAGKSGATGTGGGGATGAGGKGGSSAGAGGTAGGAAGSSGSSDGGSAGANGGSAGANGGSAGANGGSAGANGGSAGASGAPGGSGGDAGAAGSGGSSGSAGSGGGSAGTGNAGAGGSSGAGGAGTSNIKHVVLLVQENHTFDNYFGSYCTAPTGTAPSCTTGPSCCEASPATEPSGASPIVLDDAANAARDPNHTQACELTEIDGGKMDGFVTGNGVNCADAKNFAIADTAADYYRGLAANGAIADRYFQSVAGQSSANDMYLATAKFVFLDNADEPNAVGKSCSFNKNVKTFPDATIADLLLAGGSTFGVYAEGYDVMTAAVAGNKCPPAPSDCGIKFSFYPCVYDPSDIPFAYYPTLTDKPAYFHDLAQVTTDASAGTLPSFSFVKVIGYKSEHPGYGDKISAGTTAAKAIVDAVMAGPDADETLILITWDEGGGFFDHVPPPPTSAIDNQPYGTRVPLVAVGKFARQNAVSHTVMEHSSVVKFLEWNFLGATGQLNARDTEVANIGSLLDPATTGIVVPEN